MTARLLLSFQESGHMDCLRRLTFHFALFAVAPAIAAEPPRVQFDTPYVVACRDVTPANYVASHPGYKLIEAKLEISSLLVAGHEKDLTHYFVRVESPQHTLAI